MWRGAAFTRSRRAGGVEHRVDAGHVMTAILLVVLVAVYFLPSIVTFEGERRSDPAILVLNPLLG